MNVEIEIPVPELKAVLPGLARIISRSSRLPVLQSVKVSLSQDEKTIELQLRREGRIVLAARPNAGVERKRRGFRSHKVEALLLPWRGYIDVELSQFAKVPILEAPNFNPGVKSLFRPAVQPCQQSRKPLLRPIVPHRQRQRLPLADKHHQLLAPGDSGVNQVPLQQQYCCMARGMTTTGNSDPCDL